MSKHDMLASVIRGCVGVPQNRLGLLADIANKLREEKEGGEWYSILSRTLRTGLARLKKAAKPVDTLFEFVASFKTSETKEFVAKEKYVIDTSENARVRISYLGPNFNAHLLSKVERNVGAAELNLQKLRRASIDLPKNAEEPGTIAGLGGLEKAGTCLCEFFEALAYKQSLGDFSWLVGFIRDADDNNVLWAVNALWNDVGWLVGAHSPSDPDGWNAGYEFVSR